MPSIYSDQSEHHIRDIFMYFLLLNKEKAPQGILSLWVRHEPSLQSRANIPTSSEETTLPRYCWLRSPFKSFSWNDNKIFIKLCIWTMSGHSQQSTIFSFFEFLVLFLIRSYTTSERWPFIVSNLWPPL